MKLTPLKARFRLIAIWLLIAAVFILAGVGIWAELHKEEAPVAEPINPIFEELPAPLFPAVSNLVFAKDFSLSAPQEKSTADFFPETVKVYKIASQSAGVASDVAARRIADRLGFTDNFQDSQDAWIFQSEEGALFVNKSDLSWDLERQASESGARILSKEDILSALVNFLKERGFWKDLLNEAAVSYTGYDVTGVVVSAPSDPDNPQLWDLSWTMKKDGLDIYGLRDTALLTVRISKSGAMQKIHYAVGEIEWEIAGTYPARSFEAWQEDLQQGRGVVIKAEEPGQFYSLVRGEITSFAVQSMTKLYYQDLKNGYLVPVWEASGQARLSSGKYAVVKVWIMGVSGEWLK